MKKLISLFLILSLLSFTSCTTLTAAEDCALAGQALEGMIASTYPPYGGTGLPLCKVAKTEEEKATVEELMPIAQEKNKREEQNFGCSLVVRMVVQHS